MSKLMNCPYINCNHDTLAEKSKICPDCKKGIIWCNLCGSSNSAWAIYCRACGGGKRMQKLPNMDWRMLKGNPQLTSSTQYHCIYPKSKQMIKSLWTRNLPHQFKAHPISAYGNLICLSMDGNLFFLKESDGTIDGEGPLIQLDGNGYYAPAVDIWALFVSSTEILVAYDLRSNKEIWSYRIPEGLFNTDIVTSSGSAIICSYSPDDKKGWVFCFSASRDRPVWSIPLEGKGMVSTPIFIDNQLMVGCSDGSLFHIDSRTGEIIGKLDGSRGIQGGINNLVVPVCHRKMGYYVNNEGELFGVSILKSEIQTKRITDLKADFVYGIAISDSYLFVTCNWGVIVFNKSFQRQWDTKEKDEVGEITGPPIICGDTAFAASTNGKAFFCKLPDRKPNYQSLQFSDHYQTGAFVMASHKNFYILSDSGEIMALTIDEGTHI